LFTEARNQAPAVIVLDQFEAITRRRNKPLATAQLLTELDGFRTERPVLFVGIADRLELVEPALLRRLRAIRIGLPGPADRSDIVVVQARRFRIDVGELIEPLVAATEGWTGDEIRALFRDAFVGQWREGVPADAERLGELAGRHQRARRELGQSRTAHD
jgi:transitional endoplasmic reticulum ATPase